MAQDYQAKWEKCLEIIRDNVGQTKFDTWFACAKAVAYDPEQNKLTIGLPSHYFYERYEDTFLHLVHAVLCRVFGPTAKLSYFIGVIANDESANVTISSTVRSRAVTDPIEAAHKAADANRIMYAPNESRLNPTYNFENYIVGESNRLPVTIAKFIANNPQKAEFNPFFLYGNVGVGKTHLIQAIGIRIKEQNPRAEIAYLTMREFTNQYAMAKMNKAIPDFINWYQHIDVLLLDDLQELSGKEGTMNVLYPIFNHLHQHNKKLVFTCDRPPCALEGITDRLIDRFKWGITEELLPPDYNLRRDILTHKSRKNGLEISPEIIDYIAEKATGSVRELEGVVMGIMTRAIQCNSPITLDLAKSVLKKIVRVDKKQNINFDMIVECTAEHFSLNTDVIFSKSRVRDIADARQAIMYLASKHTDLSTPAIGQRLNRRYTTVLHGISAVKDRLKVSADMQAMISEIETDLAAVASK